jgi:CHAT domain-containing protein
LGVVTPTDLIQSHSNSAFNIGYAVEMAGFTLTEALPLMQGLASKVANPQDYLAEAVKWTGGQPFLIQRLLGMMEKELAGIATPENIAEWVENLVQERIVTNWESQDAPPHLTTIRDRVLSVEEKLRGRMLGCYQQVLADGELEDDRSEERSRLRLTGLVVRRDGRLISYNPIYGAVFNNAWVEGQLADLRPEFYGSAFRAWQGSEIKDGFLLRGEALRNAEIWARGKRLSDVDEDFLRESREIEKLESNLKFEVEQQARAVAEERAIILDDAKQKADRRVKAGSAILVATLALAAGAGLWAVRSLNESNQRIAKTEQDAKVVIDKARDIEGNAYEVQKKAEIDKQKSEDSAKTALGKKKEADQKVEEAKENLASAEKKLETIDRESKEQLDKATQDVQDAEMKVSQARQEQQQAQQAVEEQISKSQAEAQKIQSEIAKKATEFSRLSVEFEQARNQMRLAQQAIIESVGDTPARIERETGQRPAIVYISFINSGNTSKANDALGILMITDKGQVSKQILIEKSKLNSLFSYFRRTIGDSESESEEYLGAGKKLYETLIKPIDSELQKQQINNLVFITDNPTLRTIPLAALYDGKQFLIEKYSIGVMPGLNLTDTRYTDIKNANVLAMGLSKAKLDYPALPSVEKELTDIKSVLEGRFEVFLNEDFTLENFRFQSQKKLFQIIHISTIGESSASKQAYFLMWDRQISQDKFDLLELEKSSIELLVLSTCQSGLGNKDTTGFETKFGLAGQAIKSGVKSVIASLFIVSDLGTATLMTEFYKQLKTAPTKSEALRQAQISILRYKPTFKERQLRKSSKEKAGVTIEPRLRSNSTQPDVSHPYYWASFTIIGNPW